ncbi:MAG: hypothetical protein V7644_2452 [Actinomycetota bacterium]
MPPGAQRVTIAPRATSFTAICELCLALDTAAGWSSSTFAGRLDLDLGGAVFLCRRGHAVHVERLEPRAGEGGATAAA